MLSYLGSAYLSSLPLVAHFSHAGIFLRISRFAPGSRALQAVLAIWDTFPPYVFIIWVSSQMSLPQRGLPFLPVVGRIMTLQRGPCPTPWNLLCYLTRQKRISRYDEVKDFEMRILSWIIWADPKSSEGFLWGKEGAKRVRVREGDVMTQVEVSEMQGPVPRNAGNLQNMEKVRNGFLPRTSKRNTDLPTHFRLLTSRIIRQQISIVLIQNNCGNLLQ